MHFIETQQGFMDYIRDPKKPLPADIEPRRMKVYRELFFNNVNGFVTNAFPVLNSLYAEEHWLSLVQQFFSQHDCHSPIFIDIAGEFLQFLQQYELTENDPVFMLELAHYEWLELYIATVQSNQSQKSFSVDVLQSTPLQMASSAKVAQYQFDVQHISVDYQPIEPPQQPQYFCVYRDQQEEVSFLQLNPLTAQVLAFIEQNTNQHDTLMFDDLMAWLVECYPTMDNEVLYDGCVQLLSQMIDKHIVVTTR
ncbi:DNA-binding domain-containing protein [Shewanella gaetbuli]|uniref:DNA-binding domain-containing protein n=1 Tax=Shewanella gaetbuli TaxID=220752 RepID=A0A9X1ZR08_9GAMM|nr:putative DNA-binding domain-containing protein [Shewanella gaetbuli]MCL1143992.1 putative DNA-binding domain-containing protein [Shewanella gaetbuli]